MRQLASYDGGELVGEQFRVGLDALILKSSGDVHPGGENACIIEPLLLHLLAGDELEQLPGLFGMLGVGTDHPGADPGGGGEFGLQARFHRHRGSLQHVKSTEVGVVGVDDRRRPARAQQHGNLLIGHLLSHGPGVLRRNPRRNDLVHSDQLHEELEGFLGFGTVEGRALVVGRQIVPTMAEQDGREAQLEPRVDRPNRAKAPGVDCAVAVPVPGESRGIVLELIPGGGSCGRIQARLLEEVLVVEHDHGHEVTRQGVVLALILHQLQSLREPGGQKVTAIHAFLGLDEGGDVIEIPLLDEGLQ